MRKAEVFVRKAIEYILAVLGCAIVALVVGLVLSGLSASGVVDMQITHVLFFLAFAISAIAAPLATWLIFPSWKLSSLAFVSTVIIVGGCLWHLDSWLVNEKAKQDAANRTPPSIDKAPSLPQHVPISKTPATKHVTSQQDNSVHVDRGSKIEQHTSGNCSPAIVGGSNTVNCAPPVRHLADKQKTDLGDLIVPDGVAITLSLSGQDTDSQKLGYEIFQACGGKITKENFSPIAVYNGAPPQDVIVRIHDRQSSALVDLAKTIAQDLRAPSIRVLAGIDSAAKPNMVEIIVGPPSSGK